MTKEQPYGIDAIEEYLPQQIVDANQVFLAFNNDTDGIDFRLWWIEQGAAAFAEWRKIERR